MANPILQLLEALRNMFTCDIGIDLGTANTLVYMKGRGIIIREPSVVAVDARTDELRVRCVGHEAKAIIGAAPNSILAVRPLKDGVIADFDITAAMLQSFIRQACGSRLFVRPRVVICVPSGVTEVERRAVRQAAAWGMPAIGITDHGVASSFPAALNASKNKVAGTDQNIKILYGCYQPFRHCGIPQRALRRRCAGSEHYQFYQAQIQPAGGRTHC